MKKNIPALLVFISGLLLFSCRQQSESLRDTVPVTEYKTEVFLDSENTDMKDEFFQDVRCVRYNSSTKEIIALDYMASRLFFFTEDGKFIRKIGSSGQGPGEFMGIYFMEIADDGDIYVREDIGKRMSVLDKYGNYKFSFKINAAVNSSFAITGDKKIIINSMTHGYYLSILDSLGTVIRNIGAWSERSNKISANKIKLFSAGYTVYLKKDKSIVFVLYGLREIHKYTLTGKLIEKKTYEEVFKDLIVKEKYDIPELVANQRRVALSCMVRAARLKDDVIFLKSVPDSRTYDVEFIQLNSDLDIIGRILLKNDDPIIKFHLDFSFFNNDEFLFAACQDARLLKFVPIN